ncbi:MAG: hypothetical protein NTX81_01745 [Candidatus Bathyarchaeota archaeon]|nr:hypothetical protein [Candidatus Bathyarchaeota archaeon]
MQREDKNKMKKIDRKKTGKRALGKLRYAHLGGGVPERLYKQRKRELEKDKDDE